MNRKINPNLLKLAELTYNPNLKIDESILEEEIKHTGDINVPKLNNFIYIPSINLYVAKEKTLHDKNWYETHEELHKQNLQMLTIPQSIEFIKYLKNNYQDRKEAESILDEILTVRNPWRVEWLDAYFEERKDGLYILINNKTKAEKLEQCLMQDKTPGIDLDYWLNNHTKQGLPNKDAKQGSLYYWYPRNDTVAGFWADSGGANLGCGGNPGYSSASLGVRAVRFLK